MDRSDGLAAPPKPRSGNRIKPGEFPTSGWLYQMGGGRSVSSIWPEMAQLCNKRRESYVGRMAEFKCQTTDFYYTGSLMGF